MVPSSATEASTSRPTPCSTITLRHSARAPAGDGHRLGREATRLYERDRDHQQREADFTSSTWP